MICNADYRMKTLGKILATTFLLFAGSAVALSQGVVTRYVYDNAGRLRAVVAPDGQANIYDYDAAGNTLGVRVVPPTHLEIFAFNPKQGVPGDQVSFVGVGFGDGVNGALFNGTAAQISNVSLTSFIATVPVMATTGPITILTQSGSFTTTEPFLIQGVSITPTSAQVGPGESVQFTATVFSLDTDLSVNWSVNGIPGGNSNLGTISANGFYTAPALPSSVTIRATSNADPTLFAEAAVSLRPFAATNNAISKGVLVNKSVSVPVVIPENAPVSAGVLVTRSAQTVSETDQQSPVSAGVLISRPVVQSAEIAQGSPTSLGVLVDRQVVSTSPIDTATPASAGVLVDKQTAAGSGNNVSTPISAGVLIQRDPPVAGPVTDQLGPVSHGVLVAKTSPLEGMTFESAPIGQGVLVERATQPDPTNELAAPISSSVLVSKIGPENTPEAVLGTPISSGVLVRREVALASEVTQLAPTSAGVLIKRESTPVTPESNLFVASNGVLVTNGPIITGVSPSQFTRDTTVSITITGSNLTGTNSILFVTPNGSADNLIVISNISVNP